MAVFCILWALYTIPQQPSKITYSIRPMPRVCWVLDVWLYGFCFGHVQLNSFLFGFRPTF